MNKIFFFIAFLILTIAYADENKICIYIGAKKLEIFEKDNYRLASFYCKDGQDERFDEDSQDNKKMLSKEIPLDKAQDNNFSIEYKKNDKVIKKFKFKFYYKPLSFGNSEIKDKKNELEGVYWYERRFLMEKASLADKIQIFKGKKLVISDKINFDYYKGK